MFENGADVAGAIVSHEADSSGLFVVFVFKLFNLLIFLYDDTVQQFMLIIALVKFIVLTHSSHELLKFLDSFPILYRLGCDLFELDVKIVLFEHLAVERYALFIEFKVALDELKKEEIVVTDKGGQSGLGLYGGFV